MPLHTPSQFMAGVILPTPKRTVPDGWLLCDGTAVSRTTYDALFNAICSSLGTATMTVASPAVVTLSNHGLSLGEQVRFTTTASLPTGILPGAAYYVSTLATNTFQIATLPAGSSINTSGTQSGTHTAWYAPYGLGDLSTTFAVPNLSGYWPNGHSSTYPQGYSNSAPTHTHGVGSLTLASHTHSIPSLSVPSLSVTGHTHTLAAGYALKHWNTATGAIKLKTGATAWTRTHLLPFDISTNSLSLFTNHTSAIGIAGSTDSGTSSTVAGGTQSGTSGQPSTNAIGGSLGNNSTNSLPPHVGSKYMIKY